MRKIIFVLLKTIEIGLLILLGKFLIVFGKYLDMSIFGHACVKPGCIVCFFYGFMAVLLIFMCLLFLFPFFVGIFQCIKWFISFNWKISGTIVKFIERKK